MNSLQKTLVLVARLIKITLRNPSRLPHVLGSALAASAEVADPALDLLRIPRVYVEDLLPEKSGNERLTLALFPKTSCSVSVLEYLSLALLLKKAGATRVFEFGTYKGVSITQLALNVPASGRICTLDLPEGQADVAFAIPDPDESHLARESGKGGMVPAELRGRIEFLKQDSAKFDETPFAGQVDFVFVDGAHSADYVRSDSEKGWRMLRSGGVIAWHDFRVEDADVVRYLLQSSFKPSQICGTSLAFAVKP